MDTKIVRGWRKGVIERRVSALMPKGYVLLGPVLSVNIGRRYMATMVRG